MPQPVGVELLLYAGVFSVAAALVPLSSVVEVPEVVGGPTCCMFDSPFLALRVNATTTLSYTANSQSYLWSDGPDVDATLPTPEFTGLGPDPDNTSYSHCGKWLNAAWVDAEGTIHGYFHQEWHCDYADGDYTNKSVAYARSTDGGRTFVPSPAPSANDPAANQLIAGANFSAAHQTGEGDHQAIQVDDEWLHMYFAEWDGPGGACTIGVARSAVADAGAPGTWWKWHGGAWASPGIGGSSDALAGMPGTAVYRVPASGGLVAVGVLSSAAMGVSWSGDGLQWAHAAAGPLFNAAWSDWNRNANSSELFGYAALTGPEGSATIPASGGFNYFTYLAPGTDFTHRWLVRRPVQFLAPLGDAPPPPALAALSVWSLPAAPPPPSAVPQAWVTAGPVTNVSGAYALTRPLLAYVTTAPAPGLLRLDECALPPATPGGPAVVALALETEGCGSGEAGPFGAGAVLRSPGWVAPSADAAAALGWAAVRQPETNATLGAQPAPLWRCRAISAGAAAPRGGPVYYSATLGDPTCADAGPGYTPDYLLGYALGPLVPAQA